MGYAHTRALSETDQSAAESPTLCAVPGVGRSNRRALMHAASNASAPIQRIAVGLVPNNPNSWRGRTTVRGWSNATVGFGTFNSSDLNAVATSNLAAGPVAAPVTAGPYPGSDVTGGALLGRAEAGQVAPEVDHVVPRSDGGANDGDNARLISKLENNSTVVNNNRPTGNQLSMRLYDDIDVVTAHYGGTGTFDAGDDLPFNAVKDLARYSGATIPTSWANVDATCVDTIIRDTAGTGMYQGVDIQ